MRLHYKLSMYVLLTSSIFPLVATIITLMMQLYDFDILHVVI